MAGVLSGQQEANNPNRLVLQDLTPLSLGVKLAGNAVRKLIKRQSAIPISHEERFVTAKANQDKVTIRVLQGESEQAN